MKALTFFLIFFFSINLGFSQVTDVVEQFGLDASVSESSGLICYNGKIIMHNDSGNPTELYEMDPSSSSITRIVTLTGITNVDWEDITQDADYIYIGDIGNNNGDRSDLKIYKISKTEYNASNTVSAETINFSYANQSDYTSSPQATPWDAETLISLDTNNLLIISKNWENHVAQTYLAPKSPGTYVLPPQTSTLYNAIYPNDLITGGTYNSLTHKVFLIGYTWNPNVFDVLQPFIYECSGYTGTDVFSGINTRYDISGAPGNFSYEQAEGIAYVDENTYYVTSETFDTGYGISDYGKLIEVTTADAELSISDLNQTTIGLYPNPTTGEVHINNANNSLVEVYDMQAKLLLQTHGATVDISAFSSGIYVFKIIQANKGVTIKKVLKE